MSDDDDEAPMTGKLKGGPKKISDVKPTKMVKISAPKAEKAGKSSFKAPKVGKISGGKAQNFVKGHVSTKKADTKFKIPSPGAMKPIKKGKK